VVVATGLGLLLGFVALESGSIVPGMLIHLVNNGIQVLVDRSPALAARLDGPAVLGTALIATVAGLLLVRGSRARISPARAALAVGSASGRP
jgi:hypothetical protein